MLEKKIKVGIIGSGFGADLHANAYLHGHYAEVVAISSNDEASAENLCKKYSIPSYYAEYEKMLERDDIDLISVCVPNYLHKQMTCSSANAGKHIVCEKPITTTINDAELMIDACNKNNVKLMYAEDWIFSPALVRAKAICNEGAIGEVLYIKAKESHSGSHSVFAQKIKHCGGGAAIHLGIHPIGFIRWFKGKEVIEVIGKTSPGGEENLQHHNYEGEDWAVGILTFEDNTYGLVEGNYITKGGLDDIIEIYGTKGNIKVNLSQGSPIEVFSLDGYSYAVEKAEMTKGWTRAAVDENIFLGYNDEISCFVDCIRLNKPIPYGVRGEDGLSALKIALSICESSKNGKAIRLIN